MISQKNLTQKCLIFAFSGRNDSLKGPRVQSPISASFPRAKYGKLSFTSSGVAFRTKLLKQTTLGIRSIILRSQVAIIMESQQLWPQKHHQYHPPPLKARVNKNGGTYLGRVVDMVEICWYKCFQRFWDRSVGLVEGQFSEKSPLFDEHLAPTNYQFLRKRERLKSTAWKPCSKQTINQTINQTNKQTMKPIQPCGKTRSFIDVPPQLAESLEQKNGHRKKKSIPVSHEKRNEYPILLVG